VDNLPELAFDAPDSWESLSDAERGRSMLEGDGCEIHGEDGDFYYVRGLLELPVREGGTWAFGVWCALTEAGFERYVELFDDPRRHEEPPWASRLANELPGYPGSLNLKGRLHVLDPALRPALVLDDADHRLVRDQRDGVTLEWVHSLLAATVS
jgi:hypothetical protein